MICHYILQKNLLIVALGIILLFFTNNVQSQTYVINNYKAVHSFTLDANANEFAVPNKFEARGLNGRRQSVPAYNYFYEFPDGTYYISSNSYVRRISDDMEFGTQFDNSSVVFKGTKIYDEEDDDDDEEMRLQTGNNLNTTALPPNSAMFRNSDELEIKISHKTNSIILNEEYVIVIDLPSNFKGQDILLLYNETRKKIFTTNRLMAPRPPNSNNISSISDQNNFTNHFYFRSPQQNIFVNLKTKSVSQFEANEIFTIRAYMLDDGNPISSPVDLKLTFLGNQARAHDPNDILVNPSCIDKSNIPKELDYTVRFQNIGGAPATNVLIEVSLPAAINMEAIDNNSFFVNTYNEPNLKLPAPNYNFYINKISRKINFNLNGVNLDGLEEVGRLQEKKTKGSVNFKLPLKQNGLNKTIECIATILFEDGLENDATCVHLCDSDGTYPALDAITTEPAITSFKKFHSLKPNKVNAGIDYILNDNIPGLFVGIAAAPSACNLGIYNQYELNFAYSRYVCNSGTIDTAACITYASNNKNNTEINEWEVESSTYALGIVPLQLKYNLSNTLSVGAGVEFRGIYKTGKFHQLNTGTIQRNDLLFDASVFADVKFGSNTTFNYGLRYLYGYRYDFSDNGIANQYTNQSRAQLYVQRIF